MRICITGGNGMIGVCIRSICLEYREHDFIFLHRNGGENSVDLTNKDEVNKYFSNENFDAIIHLAADVGGLYKNMKNNVEIFNNNLNINQNILEAANKNNIKKGIFCLSSCIYPENPKKFPMDETMVHDGPPHNSNMGYAFAKRMLEVQCRNYNNQYGREYICVTPVNMYGPFDNFSLKDGHLIPMIMHRFYNEQNNFNHAHPEEQFIAYGTGKPLRQFLYAPDFAKIILKILFGENVNHKSFICCNNEEYSIKEVIEKMADVMEIPRDSIIWDTSKSDGCFKKTVTNERFKNEFPNFEFTNLNEGLKLTYSWFKKNYSIIRK